MIGYSRLVPKTLRFTINCVIIGAFAKQCTIVFTRLRNSSSCSSSAGVRWSRSLGQMSMLINARLTWGVYEEWSIVRVPVVRTRRRFQRDGVRAEGQSYWWTAIAPRANQIRPIYGKRAIRMPAGVSRLVTDYSRESRQTGAVRSWVCLTYKL